MFEWWRLLSSADKRESDERNQQIWLLSIRDAFVAILVLVSLLFILPRMIPGVDWAQSAVPTLPLIVLFVSSIVMLVSWAVRGGGESLPATVYRGIVTVVGFVIAGVIIQILFRLGIVAEPPIGFVTWTIGSVVGICIGVGLIIATSRRNR